MACSTASGAVVGGRHCWQRLGGPSSPSPSVGTTSKIVDRLEKLGWLERSPNPANRRSSLLALTPAGEAVVSRAEPAWRTAIQEIFGGAVTPGQLTALVLALDALRSDLERRQVGLPTG